MEPDVLLRQIEAIQRDKNIDREVLFQGIESALASVAKKRLRTKSMPVVHIDRETGEIRAFDGEEEIDPEELGRIAAQTAKQIIVQKIREAERDAIMHDLGAKKGEIITGSVLRHERGHIIVGLGRTEAILPKNEQIPGDTYRRGEHMRALLVEVKRTDTGVTAVLSRSHPDFVRHLFSIEVPEVREGIVEIKAIAREPGRRTKIAVHSTGPGIDPVGACVGIRGTRIKSIVEELNGEKIDVIRWSDNRQELIANALKPAEVAAIEYFAEEKKAVVHVTKDQLSLALGKKGQNVRLASKLSKCTIDIVCLEEETSDQEATADKTVTPQTSEVTSEATGDVISLEKASSADDTSAVVELEESSYAKDQPESEEAEGEDASE